MWDWNTHLSRWAQQDTQLRLPQSGKTQRVTDGVCQSAVSSASLSLTLCSNLPSVNQTGWLKTRQTITQPQNQSRFRSFRAGSDFTSCHCLLTSQWTKWVRWFPSNRRTRGVSVRTESDEWNQNQINMKMKKTRCQNFWSFYRQMTERLLTLKSLWVKIILLIQVWSPG